jgi:hypothetical protein
MPVGPTASAPDPAIPLYGWRQAPPEPIAMPAPSAPSPTGAPAPAPTPLPAPTPVGPVVVDGSSPFPYGPMNPGACDPSGMVCDGCPGTDGCPGGCCAGMGNRWYASAEYLLWWTKGDRTPPLVTTGSIGAANPGGFDDPSQRTLFGGNSQFGDRARSGARFGLGFWFTDDHSLGLEDNYFFLGRQTENFSAFSIGGSPILARPILRPGGASAVELISNPERGTFPNPGFLPGADGSVGISHHSSLWGNELNLRSNLWCGCNGYVDLIGGFRTLALDEGLGITEVVVSRAQDPNFNAAFPNNGFGTVRGLTDSFEARNRFYGGQLGLVGEYRMERWSLGGSFKLGLGSTQQIVDIQGSTMANGVVTGPGLLAGPLNSGRHTHDSVSFVPEIGLTLGYNFTDNLRGYVGYNFLYWTRVARPGDQIDPTVSPPNGPTTNPMFIWHQSNFWAQGINFGLEYRF